MTETSASAPSKVPSPVLVASWERLGLLPADRVPLWAAYWIAGGHDGEALIHLAGLHGDDSREVHDALPGALMDCGVEMPDSDVPRPVSYLLISLVCTWTVLPVRCGSCRRSTALSMSPNLETQQEWRICRLARCGTSTGNCSLTDGAFYRAGLSRS